MKMFEFNGFFGESRFRIWCQKVLPTIYDDSLSYYELLCKVLKVLEEYGQGSTELANEIVSIKEQLGTLGGRVTDNTENLDELAQRVTDMSSRIDGLEDSVSLAKGLETVGQYSVDVGGYFYLNECITDNGGEPTGYYFFPEDFTTPELVNLIKTSRLAYIWYQGEYADFKGIITLGTVYHSGYYGLYHNDYSQFAKFGLTVLTQPDPDDYEIEKDFIVCSKEVGDMIARVAQSCTTFDLTFYK